MAKAWGRLLAWLKGLFFPCEKTMQSLVSGHLLSIEQNSQALCRLDALCQLKNSATAPLAIKKTALR
jgi:hypothetical protein